MRLLQKLFLLVACMLVASGLSCVGDRPSRNGVFNENHYLRKSFLIAPGDHDTTDPGWMMKVTVVSVSTPNPLGSDVFGISPGIDGGGQLVRFRVGETHLDLLSMREVTGVPSGQRTEDVIDSWPITNVDVKYRVNLDGEITNFLEENQEQDWQVRQWVKLAFDKHDLSDFAGMGAYTSEALANCTDTANTSTSVVPDSFYTDESRGYMQWVLRVTMPLRYDVPECVQAYGDLGLTAQRLGRDTVTVDLMYSFVRANPAPTYQPLVVDEHDPIRHKYGFFETIGVNRDESSGQLAAQNMVNRWDPQGGPITWYFAQGFPEQYKPFFNGPGGIADQTNTILRNVGATAQVQFKNFDQDLAQGERPRQYGDIRYSFLVWISDRDTQNMFAGVTPSVVDPRTGQVISSSITLSDFAIKDLYVERIDAYLRTIGASQGIDTPGMWDDGPAGCQDGDTMPLVPASIATNHNGASSLFQKMQQYLQRPSTTYGPLGPRDFVVQHNDDSNDFFNAYYALLPYQIFSDPEANAYVTPEGGGGVYGPGDNMWARLQQETQFQQLAASIDRGETPFEGGDGPNGVQAATTFLNRFRDLTTAHNNYLYAQRFVGHGMHMDGPDSFSFEEVIDRDARHCVNGHWETKDEWTANLISTYWSQVAWHEFGHSMGLTHNFMASVDRNNFPQYRDGANRVHDALYASSVMEYNASPDRIFWHPGWGPYDQAAIAWIYGNTAPHGDRSTTSISGQTTATSPWNDPLGFHMNMDGTVSETQFLFCNEYHMRYTPLCRQGDLGTTPSEIIANDIERYEWQYQWRNFRLYRRFWNDSEYANEPAAFVTDMRRFISQWAFDWSSGELADSLRRIGVTPPANIPAQQYYDQLTNKFTADISAANQMVAAFHEAIIQQSSGERPYRTTFDRFFGDVTQQGIILDKLFAMQGWVGLWPTQNYDPNQAGGYIASYEGLGDASYNYVAQNSLTSMIGGQYDVFPYFVPLAVAQFAQDSHSPSFAGQVQVRDWIGGHVFYRLQDFLDYFRDIAVTNNLPGCTSVANCTYDPRSLSDTHNEFVGPDSRRWIWAYVADRNQWVAVERDRNTATYIIVRNYTDFVIYQQDDGAFPGGAYGAELPMKYFLDSFNTYN